MTCAYFIILAPPFKMLTSMIEVSRLKSIPKYSLHLVCHFFNEKFCEPNEALRRVYLERSRADNKGKRKYLN